MYLDLPVTTPDRKGNIEKPYQKLNACHDVLCSFDAEEVSMNHCNAANFIDALVAKGRPLGSSGHFRCR